MKFGTYFPE